MTTLKSQILGRMIYAITSLLKASLRIDIDSDPEYNPMQQYLFAFWHGKQLLPVWTLGKLQKTERAVLVSPSKDGDILSVWLKQLGYDIIRGSSRHKNIAALAAMQRRLKQGCALGYGIDGPIGPIHKVKPGMTHMAQKFNIPIIPVGSAFSEKWVVEKAWDRYEIPKPFSRASFYLGKPFTIEKSLDLEVCNLQLETLIHEAEDKALDQLNK